ncbi:MAG TPA: phenylalanine--tRNA ligase subunit beta, partial [Candidatus Paceibacterota bacterium]|nr:phenylalanine--tRNA ligase subunit beta [Candidatus Paceibacterota bacterium]
MKVSVVWLQKYFNEPLPNTEELVDALTFHSSEVEEVVGEGTNAMLDVKVLPDRAPYALSHRGVALELAAALDRALAVDPLRDSLPAYEPTDRIKIFIENPDMCTRYMAALVTGVKVGPSPEWLKASLEAVGQRSINNVVDATNYVMLNIGQPLHAFDAGKLEKNADGAYAIGVRGAHEGEKITTLTGEEFTLPEGTLVIADENANAALGIAGIKGGRRAEVTNDTIDILIESANFEGTTVRRASQALKLWTDASLRFQNRISSELAAYGMRDVLALILEVAGGEVVAAVDAYAKPEAAQAAVSATREQLNGLLGINFSMEEIQNALTRLSLPHVVEGEMVTVQPPFERRDLTQWQDLAEEVGRILGYDRVAPAALPAMPAMQAAPDQAAWRGIEALKDVLIDRGFTEISTPSFAAEGEILLANPLQQERPYLRASLGANMQDALMRAAQQAPRVLGPEPILKLFELGTVFTKDDEHLSLCLGYQQLSGKPSTSVLAEAVDALTSAFPSAGIVAPSACDGWIVEMSLKDVRFETVGAQAQPARYALGPYQSFSIYPFALRDIAVWTPSGTEESEVALLIQQAAGPLLVRMDLFDRFEKAQD